MGSYDAIRVYLWLGMDAGNDGFKARMLKHLRPMATVTASQGLPPENVTIASGETRGAGPVGFSAALLPFLTDAAVLEAQRLRVEREFPRGDAYYNYSLALFGQGWDQRRFRFNSLGELVPNWGPRCASIH